MYRKKWMRACLTGVMVVTIVTANVAPVFAAEPIGTVQTAEEPGAGAEITIRFKDVDWNGEQVGKDQVLSFKEGSYDYSVLKEFCPEHFRIAETGTFDVVNGSVIEVDVEQVMTAIINYYDESVEKQIAEVPIEVPARLYTLDLATVKANLPDNYELVSSPDGDEFEIAGGPDMWSGYVYAAVREVKKPITQTVNINYYDESGAGHQVAEIPVEVPAGTTVLDESVIVKNLPSGYDIVNTDGEIRDGYVYVSVQRIAKAATMKVVYKDQFTQEVVGEEMLTGSRQDAEGNYVFDAAVDFNIPFGYQLAVDYPVEILKAGETRVTECLVTARETVLHITFETQDGEVVGTKTVSTTAQGANGECWTFMLGTDFELPEGYKLAEGVDQITNIQIPFGATGGHTMLVEKEDKSSIVKIQFVDAETDEVVAGGDYFVDADGDGIFNHTEVLEWVPEGYELQEFGDFQVEFYKETPLQLSVTKIAEEPENPDSENPNEPEKPETPDKEDTGKEDTKKEDQKKTSPKTGDETNAAAAALPAGVSLAAILAVLVKKFK